MSAFLLTTYNYHHTGIEGDDAYGLPAPDHQQAESRAQCAIEDIVTGEAEEQELLVINNNSHT